MDRSFCIAPMMARTDRHFRYLVRQLTRKAVLFTEMIHTNSILFGNRNRLDDYFEIENPIVLQLGGNDPDSLSKVCKMAEHYNYDEINLNLGCPSPKVKSGNFSESDDQDDSTLNEDGNTEVSGEGDDDSNADVNSAVYDTQATSVSTYYRWDTHTVENGDSGDNSWNQTCVNASCDDAPSAWTYTNTNNTYDGSSRSIINTQGVSLSLPDDGSVKVQMGNQVVVPLTITPSVDEITGLPTKVAGFEFEVRYKEEQLQFIDAQTGLLPGPWICLLYTSPSPRDS